MNSPLTQNTVKPMETEVTACGLLSKLSASLTTTDRPGVIENSRSFSTEFVLGVMERKISVFFRRGYVTRVTQK